MTTTSARGRVVAALVTALACGLLAACGGDTGAWITGAEQEELQAPLPSTAPELRSQLVRLEELLSTEERTGPGQSERHALGCSRLRNLTFDVDLSAPEYGLSRWGDELLDRADGWCDDEPRTAAQLVGRARAELR